MCIEAAAVAAKARALGFNMVGFIPAHPARRLDAYLRWVSQAMHGEMAYMARPDRVARRQDLHTILPGVKTVICVGLDYFTQHVPAALAHDPARGRIANYAWGVDYHEVMTPRLQELAHWLAAQDTAVFSRVYVDTGAILERDHAETAGLGFTGKNSMLIHPQKGSFFFLGEILTTLEIRDQAAEIYLQASTPSSHPPISCGSCRRCLDACPTHAFPQPYVLDARRCISYLTIELKGWLPPALRPLMGNWVFGCDICQEVCPFNRFAGQTSEPAFYPLADRMAPPLLDLLSLDEPGFQHRFAHSPIYRIKRARFLRNVCVAAGNWGSVTAVSPLVTLLADPEPLIRGHAAWALHQIGTPQSLAALAAALETEADETVRRELAAT